MQNPTVPVPRNYFDLAINLHCDLPDVYRINNNVDVQIQAAFPMTPWSQTYMVVYIERYLEGKWQPCDAAKKTVFKNFRGSLNEELTPSQPPVLVDLCGDNTSLMLRSTAAGFHMHYLRFQMDIAKTNQGFKRGAPAHFRLVFMLLEEVWPVQGSAQVIALQTKYSSVFDVINGGRNEAFVKRGNVIPAHDPNIYFPVPNVPANTQNFMAFIDNEYDAESYPELESILNGDDSFMTLTNQTRPTQGPNSLLDNGGDIVDLMSKIALGQDLKQQETKKQNDQQDEKTENERIAKLLRDGFKFVVRKREQNRTVLPNIGQATNAAGDDIPKQVPVPVLHDGDVIEIILQNNLDDQCGFNVSGAVHTPSVEALEFESPNGNIEKDGVFVHVPKNSFVCTAMTVGQATEPVVTLTLATRVVMDNDKSEKYFIFRRRCVIDDSDE